MSKALELFVLGRPRVWLDGRPAVDLVSAKAQALLAYLALDGAAHSRGALAGLFWGQLPEETARANLRQTLTKLRKAVGDYLIISWETVEFNRALPHRVDAAEFLALVEESRGHRHRHPAICSSCAERWRRAVALYQQPLLHDFALDDCPDFELWAVSRREHLHRRAMEALDLLSEHCLGDADYARAQGYARRAIELDPFHEPGYRQLMRALAYAGQRSAALACYQSYARQLGAELDAEPEPATRALHEAIRQGGLAPPAAPPHNLPAPASSFVGRAADLADVGRRLEDPLCRLLTLVGPGGVGKTRLAIEAARAVARYFADGVVFVPLAAVLDPAFVLGAVAQALAVKDTGGQPLIERLKAALRPKELLLLLDNFEHLLDGAPLVAELLAACPRLAVLATSREPLHLTGEHCYPVAPLPTLSEAEIRALPPERLLQTDGVRLFVERARALAAEAQLGGPAAATVAAICRRLDGLPLAIELATGQLRRSSPATILEQLSQPAAAPLQLLVGGARDLPPRQQTIRDTIAWSYRLLDGAEQRLFQRLAVFQGGGSPAAIAAVCADEGAAPAAALAGLVEKQLLGRAGEGEAQRYSFLETIREYARELLEAAGEAGGRRERHGRFFLALVEQAAPELTGPRQQHWLAELEREHDNLRAALDWAIASGAGELALRMGGGLWRFWESRGYWGEGERWLRLALGSGADQPAALRAKALNGLGMMLWYQGSYGQARISFEECLALRRALGDQPGLAIVLNNLGMVAWSQGDYEAARRLYEECLAIDRAAGDSEGAAYSLGNLGLVFHHQGEGERARAAFAESRAIFQAAGNRRHEAFAMHNLGMALYHQGDYAGARALYEASLAIKAELGDKWGSATTQVYLAQVLCAEGELAAAGERLAASLALRRELDDPGGLAETIEGFAGYAVARDRPRAAAQLFAAAEALRAAAGAMIHAADRAERDRQRAAARARLPADRFAAALAEGQAMSLEQAVECALAVGR